MGRSIGALCISLAAVASAAHADFDRVQVTSDASWKHSVTAYGTRIAWIAGSFSNGEIFWSDVSQPLDAGAPLPCPLSNPCQLTDDAANDTDPVLFESGVLWRSGSALRFSDGTSTVAIPGTPNLYTELAVSGARVVWWGADAVATEGLFLLDGARSIDAGATEACPITNPCRIVAGTPLYGQEWARIDGSRIAWAAVPPGSGSDSEILLFDADVPAGAGPPALCPATNPCLVTSNDAGDIMPDVSGRRIAWQRCPSEPECESEQPDRILIDDGDTTLEVLDGNLGFGTKIRGPFVLWSAGFGYLLFLDTRRPIDATNPRELYASGDGVLADGRALLDTMSDVAGVPVGLLFFHLHRPIATPPAPPCPGGNPCFAVSPTYMGSHAYSGDVIAWVECENDYGCYGDTTARVFYALPEPSALAAGVAMILALRATRRRAPAPFAL